MAAARVQASSFCHRVLQKYRSLTHLTPIRCLSTVQNVQIDDSGSKNKQSLYDVYLIEKKSKERKADGPSQKKRDVGLADDHDELMRRVAEERKKVVPKDLKIDLTKQEWTENSLRAGAIGVKIGMSSLWRKDGKRVFVSLIQAYMLCFVMLTLILVCYSYQMGLCIQANENQNKYVMLNVQTEEYGSFL